MYDPATMVTPKPFSETFKVLREQLGLTQMEAAVLLDSTPSQVSRWEGGTSVPHTLTQEGILARLRKAGRKGKPAG
jgi:DNA-binding transcriptional regulator YiaG